MRSFLLAPCLLIFLACATPFPIENLEEGMTHETVLEEFGEPEAMGLTFGVYPKPPESYWAYVHEDQNWVGTTFCLTVGLPACILLTPISLLSDGETGFSIMGVIERPVFLYFESNKLDYWKFGALRKKNLLNGNQTNSDWSMFPANDAIHHGMGHTHHHGH